VTAPSAGVVAPPRWPRARVASLLGSAGLLLVVQELLAPGWTGVVAPAVVGIVTVVVSVRVRRHGAVLPGSAGDVWRAFAVIGFLLALGQFVRAMTGAGMNPTASGPADLALAATGPVSAFICARLVRSAGTRVRFPVVLDAAVTLIAVGVLTEALLPVAGRASADADLLLTIGYPAITTVLFAVGIITFAGVSAPRRRAAAWLLAAFAALAVAMASGAVAATAPATVLDVITTLAYLAMVGSATRALASDPGPVAAESNDVPLVGVVVSYCLSFAVTLALLGSWWGGRPLVLVELVAVSALLVLTFARTLVWAADELRLKRRLLRTESYLRALVSSAEDVTVVLDGEGTITWASGAARSQLGWTLRELTGRRLPELLHEEDRDVVARAAGALVGATPVGLPVTVRLRTSTGDWRDVEISGAARSGVPGTALRDGLVLHLQDVSARRSTQRELERMAYTDYLTGLPNRARFMAALEAARARSADGEAACVLLVDLDGFKAVNDVAGHEAGDRLLTEVAERLRSGARDRDLVARLGGDEFALLVPGSAEEAAGLAERLLGLLDRSYRAPAADGLGPVFEISASIGVAPVRPDEEVATAVRQADLALRAAKAAGKNCVRSSGTAIDSAMGRRTRLARDLPTALEEGQLRVVYQPIAGIHQDRIVGLEALVRWEHPLFGTVPPDEFISLAEDDGLIVPLQRWVLEQAANEAAALLAEGWDLQVGINVSVRHLQAGSLAPDVAKVLAAAGLPKGKFVLEITESVMIGAEDRLETDFAALREMGCVIALDDFGKGYSSLAYLARLPVDVLKMDREFVADVDRDPRGAALVSSVVDLGRKLGIDVLAEGVETAGQLAALREHGVAFVQGWLLGRPVPPDELRTLLTGFDPAVLHGAAAGETDLDSGVHLVGQSG
jgi:diguanylate cyclase (GGDEF)-like protein/PAS domain S-box-containing protein